MFSRVIGALWIMLGIFWLLRPEVLRQRIIRKMTRTLKWVLFGFVVTLTISLIGSVFKANGLMIKAASVAGLIIAVRLIVVLGSKTSGRMGDWLSGRNLNFFRLWGIFIVVTGIIVMIS